MLIIVFVMLESSVTPCNLRDQQGCKEGEYCSLAFGNGGCFDCAAVLSPTTTCCPSLHNSTQCILGNWSYDVQYVEPTTGLPYPGACAMYAHCSLSDKMPYRCDYLVTGLSILKLSHVFFIFILALLVRAKRLTPSAPPRRQCALTTLNSAARSVP